jgi:hypothetical protein
MSRKKGRQSLLTSWFTMALPIIKILMDLSVCMPLDTAKALTWKSSRVHDWRINMWTEILYLFIQSQKLRICNFLVLLIRRSLLPSVHLANCMVSHPSRQQSRSFTAMRTPNLTKWLIINDTCRHKLHIMHLCLFTVCKDYTKTNANISINKSRKVYSTSQYT